MSIPSPPIALFDHCTAVWNNTLYAYSPLGFQALPLTKGAEWRKLASGVSVMGAVCAPAMIPGNEALWIVGGASSTSAAASGYVGLQRFSFHDQAWASITPSTTDLRNRVQHGAAFINSANAILVYAGSQGQAAASSTQTFLISTAPPYNVLSYNSQGAPALESPRLAPWSEDHAVMLGGSPDNTQVWVFSKAAGWSNVGTALPAGLGLTSSSVHFTIISGADGSKVLELFNLGVSPNSITRYVLFANNAPVPPGQQVGAASTSKQFLVKRMLRRVENHPSKRQLTLANWPAYNASLAPSMTRSGYSLAINHDDGLAVISGGGDAKSPIAMFDQNANAWVNATARLIDEQQPLQSASSSSTSIAPSSSTSSTSPPTSPSIVSNAPSAASTSDALGSAQSKSRALTTLGAALGAIFGFAALLIIILILLRWKKQKRRQQAGRFNEKEDRLSFADQGADFMHEAVGVRGRGYTPSSPVDTKTAHSSLGSLQIFQNKMPGHRRGVPSDSSLVPLANSKGQIGTSDPLEMARMSQLTSPTFTAHSTDLEKDISPPKLAALAPVLALSKDERAKDERSRSNGWSRYFANNEVTNLASMQGNARRNTYETDMTDMSRSEYNDDEASEGPLEVNLGPRFTSEGQRLSRVVTGSPLMGQSHEDVHRGMRAEIRRAGSTSSQGSTTEVGDSTHSASGTARTWITRSDGEDDTKSASNPFSRSNPFFSGSGIHDPRERKQSHAGPAIPRLNLQNYGDATRDSQGSTVTIFPGGRESPKAAAFPIQTRKPLTKEDFANDYGFPSPSIFFGSQNRDSQASNVTIFPGTPTSTPASNMGGVSHRTYRNAAQKGGEGEDMSWLNLNAGKAG